MQRQRADDGKGAWQKETRVGDGRRVREARHPEKTKHKADANRKKLQVTVIQGLRE